MKYQTGFQCPASGQYVTATYAFGKLTITPSLMDNETLFPETEAWVKQHTGKRFKSASEAEEYIIDVSDGQTFGF